MVDRPCSVRVSDCERASIAFIEPEKTGHWVALWWHGSDNRQVRPDTWAWIEGDTLFIPADGQSIFNRLADDTPDTSAGWYEAISDKSAIWLDGHPVVIE